MSQINHLLFAMLRFIASLTLLVYSHLSLSQTLDTNGLANELNSVLKKYGISDAQYLLSVVSKNQTGGQTAFVINNYNFQEPVLPDSVNIKLLRNQNELRIFPLQGTWSNLLVVHPKDSSDTFDEINTSANSGFPRFGNGYLTIGDDKKIPVSLFVITGAQIDNKNEFKLKAYNKYGFILVSDNTRRNKSYLYKDGKMKWIGNQNWKLE